MGVLRIKEIVDERLEKDPYELFTLDEPHRLGRRMRPEFWGAAGVSVLAAFAVAIMTFWNLQHESSGSIDLPYAYFEIKAISPDGRLVAGAVVKQGAEQLGVTDSFGEWRRFMRVKLGSTVALTITKHVAAKHLVAVKNIAVPPALPTTGDLELIGSVQLARSGAKGAPAPLHPHAEAVRAASATTARGTRRPYVPAGTEIVSDSQGMVVSRDVAAPRDFSRVALVTDGAPHGALAHVLQMLAQRCRELGVAVDPRSPWRLHVANLPAGKYLSGPHAGKENTLLLIESTYGAAGTRNEQLFSYLRNYQDGAMNTARDILWTATSHLAKPYRVTKQGGIWHVMPSGARLWALTPGRTLVDKDGHLYKVEADAARPGALILETGASEPCSPGDECTVMTPGLRGAPPVPGWHKLELKVLGATYGDTAIYVSGYAATRVQDQIYEYWGMPHSGVNVTALRDGKVLFRGRVQPRRGALPSVSLPVSTLSRR